jgi:hypothetical protein
MFGMFSSKKKLAEKEVFDNENRYVLAYSER